MEDATRVATLATISVKAPTAIEAKTFIGCTATAVTQLEVNLHNLREFLIAYPIRHGGGGIDELPIAYALRFEYLAQGKTLMRRHNAQKTGFYLSW